ncbi:hypothetical protein BHF71_09670 [Vulcanibacillus modesticaldus]|uniref:Uncharacterized protein n=1 Tax=Vulcanibacillus modesticaldus TaxID=337097 RepID=A0A1D2YU40_9BACI|nr:hypothetical protein [Vulcanibacillus modesticaldus]OEF99207.1 hypothetical protein BHF71_09670 [Vulcanibacillus modesticaldus]
MMIRVIGKFFLGMVILLIGLFIWNLLQDSSDEYVIKYFPINNKIIFTDVGSSLEIFKQDKKYMVVGESWSKTNKKVYLRQDVNLLFRNGFLKQLDYPWKEQTDWIVNKLQVPLEKDSIYTLLSYHHAEIHEDSKITSSQAVTADKLYVVSFKDYWEAFKEPKNTRQKKEKEKMDRIYSNQREKLIAKAIKELNINQSNYDIYDLDAFSLKKVNSKVIKANQWDKVLGGLWEGLYHSYVLGFTEDELKFFSPPMPWVLVDINGTHLLVIFQHSDGRFEKLIMEI